MLAPLCTMVEHTAGSTADTVGEFAPCLGDELLNHFEVSGGLEFWVWPRER